MFSAGDGADRIVFDPAADRLVPDAPHRAASFTRVAPPIKRLPMGTSRTEDKMTAQVERVREAERCCICGVELTISAEPTIGRGPDRECFDCSKLSHYEKTSLKLLVNIQMLLVAVMAPEMTLEQQVFQQIGTCRKCGCTETTPCPGGCYWADFTKTICSRCA